MLSTRTSSQLRPEIREEREPMIDVFATESNVKVTVEMPGVEKEQDQN